VTHLSRFLAIAALLAAVHAGAADSTLTGSEMVEHSRRLSLLKGGPNEFQAHLDLRLFGLAEAPIEGRMEYAWRPSGQWHREISIPNYFREIDNSGENVIYKDRSADYEPLRISLAYGLFSIATDPHPSKDLQWGKVHHGATTDCVEAKLRGFEEKWCFDTGTGALISIDQFSTRTEFGEFTKVGDRLVPTSMRLYYKKKLAVEAKTRWDFQSQTKDELFKPSPGAVDWPICSDMVPPKEDHAPSPSYPRLVPGVTGDDADVGLYVTIAADGKLRMPYVVESAGPVFDRAAVIAIRDWTFHPATCSGKPVPVQGRVEVHFKYGRGGPDVPIYR
jgi:TonB family protein